MASTSAVGAVPAAARGFAARRSAAAGGAVGSKGRAAPRGCRGRGGVILAAGKLPNPGADLKKVSVVYKFGGSSVKDAERMRAVADIVCSFPEHKPAIVLSAMGQTTNNLLKMGEAACDLEPGQVADMPMLKELRELHFETMWDLDCDANTRKDVEQLLKNLERLLTGISLMQELTDRTRDNLVSFGERMSTRIFAGFLRSHGVPSQQYDSFAIGLKTTDAFTAGDVLPETYPNIKKSLGGEIDHIPIVTGFLGCGVETGAITTLGRGGSDLSATVLSAALELPETQVWKDVDGVLTADPRFVEDTRRVPFLTYDEATELAYFGAQVLHPQAMQPAINSVQPLVVRVKNSYNIESPGTVISRKREMGEVLMTSIVKKSSVTMMDIVSTRMLGQYGFLARVFEVMQEQGISVDVVATSEVSVSLTLDPAKLWSRDLVAEELEALENEFKQFADVKTSTTHSIISLVCNVERSSEILERVFGALKRVGINVQMISQGASKTNISLLVDFDKGDLAVRTIHDEFFGDVPAVGATTEAASALA